MWWSLLACAPPEYTTAPKVAEGVVLLAQISPQAVTFSGVLDGVAQDIDLDGASDDRYGFRYSVVDDAGDIVFQRSTNGPVVVEAFLEYWSTEAGVDLLQSLPTLGRFALPIPLIDGADRVDIEVRDEAGEYQLRGVWDYDWLEDPRVEPGDWAVATETLHHGGPSEQAVDIVILGDGYRPEELDLFREQADEVRAQLLSTEPFASSPERLNLVRVVVPSEESGASYDIPERSLVSNTFGSIFAVEFVNRITGYEYSSRAIFQAEQWRVFEAAAHVKWDAVLVLVNSPGYGGMAVHVASVTTGVSDYAPTAVHELGHAFGMLGDEYVYDDCVLTGSAGLPENVTDRPQDPPWSAWIDADTPLPTPDGEGFGVGAYEGAWNCQELYRPAHDCKMRDDVEGPFCPVCQELLARRIYRFGDPASDVRVMDGRLVVRGADPGSTVRLLSGEEVLAEGTVAEPPKVPRGEPGFDVEVRATSPFVRSDPAGDLSATFHLQAQP